MSRIYELLGYPVSDNSEKAILSRKRAFCPFMNARCDGGGNRFMSELLLKEHPELQQFFTSMERVPSGICSIQLTENTSPWIICPRRLLYLGVIADEKILKGISSERIVGLSFDETVDEIRFVEGEKAEVVDLVYSAAGDADGCMSVQLIDGSSWIAGYQADTQVGARSYNLSESEKRDDMQ